MKLTSTETLLAACAACLLGSLIARTYSALIIIQATRPFYASRLSSQKYVPGSNVSPELPGDYGEVALEFRDDDSIMYPLNDSFAWNSLYPGDVGLVRLGPKGHPFGVSTYHQLHCLSFIRHAYVRGLSRLPNDLIPDDVVEHYSHCFQFVRQSILCHSDTTLIPVDGGDAPTSGAPELHRCRNWAKIREFVENNMKEWQGISLDPEALEKRIL